MTFSRTKSICFNYSKQSFVVNFFLNCHNTGWCKQQTRGHNSVISENYGHEFGVQFLVHPVGLYTVYASTMILYCIVFVALYCTVLRSIVAYLPLFLCFFRLLHVDLRLICAKHCTLLY